MADIFVDATNDIVILGGDLKFTSDEGFLETMKQRIKATLLTFLGEWFLDDPESPQVGVPYFQSLFESKLPTLELADSVFRTALINIDGVTAVEELSFELDSSVRALTVKFKVRTTGSGTVEDVVSLSELMGVS